MDKRKRRIDKVRGSMLKKKDQGLKRGKGNRENRGGKTRRVESHLVEEGKKSIMNKVEELSVQGLYVEVKDKKEVKEGEKIEQMEKKETLRQLGGGGKK